MDAFLLAAGLGTRLKPFTDLYPKCLAPIIGIPLLCIWIKKLESLEYIETIFINVHYKKGEVYAMLEELSFDKKRVHLVDEEDLIGTGGSIKSMSSLSSANEYLIIHADNYSEVDLNDFVQMYKNKSLNNKKISSAIVGFKSRDYNNCGFMVGDEMGVLSDFKEKPRREVDGLANGALFICADSIIRELVVETNAFDFSAECLPKMIGRSVIYGTNKYHVDIGSIDRLVEVNSLSSLCIENILLEGDWYSHYRQQIKAFGL